MKKRLTATEIMMKEKEENKMDKKEKERRMGFAREKAAQVWCEKKMENKVMDIELAEEFAKILVVQMYEPKLGCATTRELIEELKARIEMNENLDYRTIDS